MNKLETAISALENKIAVTWEEYSKQHPKTKKTKSDPMFTKGDDAKPSKKDESKPTRSTVPPKSEEVPPPVNNKPDPLETDDPRKSANEKPINKDPNYVFARSSEISNIGEDLVESARHKRNRWTNLGDAESNGTAKEMITRNELLKNEPPDLISKVNSHTFLTSLALHLAIQKFPAEPSLGRGYEDRPDDAIFRSNHYDPQLATEKTTIGEARKQLRKQYYDFYKEIVAKAENLAGSKSDPKAALSEIQTTVLNKVNALRKVDRYSPLANLLVRFHNAAHPNASYKANSVMGQLLVFGKNLKEKYGEEQTPKTLEQAAEHAKDIMEGDSFNKTFGKKSEGRKKFDPREFYSKEAERVGPEHKFKGVKKQTEFLTKKAGMRAIQFGNSVTDDEREFHLEQSANAFKDLTDVLGLPEELASFHGKLGLAIGARGKGNALAHYEPNLRVINLTRKGGVGSLAHEMGHFFDNLMSDAMYGSKTGFASSQAPHMPKGPSEHSEITEAFRGLHSSMMDFRVKMRDTQPFKELTSGEKTYWGSTEELFARSFEKYVAHKLGKEGRKNTYLAGVKEHPFWPDKDDMEKLAPHFDKIFDKFKASKYIKKAAMLLEIYDLERRAAVEKPYRGKFRFTHDASFLSLKGMNLEDPDKLRKEFESILKATKPEVTLGKPKVAHFNMYGRSIGAYTFPISPPEAFMHSGGGEDPSVIAFRKVCDDLTAAGFVKGKSKKKKKKSFVQSVIEDMEQKLAKLASKFFTVSLSGVLTFSNGRGFDVDTFSVSKDTLLVSFDRKEHADVEKAFAKDVSLSLLLTGTSQTVTLKGQVSQLETVSTLRIKLHPNVEFSEYVDELPDLISDGMVRTH